MSRPFVSCEFSGGRYVEQNAFQIFDWCILGAGWFIHCCVTLSVCGDQAETSRPSLINDNKVPVTLKEIYRKHKMQFLPFGNEWKWQEYTDSSVQPGQNRACLLVYGAANSKNKTTTAPPCTLLWPCGWTHSSAFSQQMDQLRIRWLLSQMTSAGSFM